VNVLLTFYFGLERPITTARRIKATQKIFLDPDQEIQFFPLTASAFPKPMTCPQCTAKRSYAHREKVLPTRSLTSACGVWHWLQK
jgi:hypothetical protein